MVWNHIHTHTPDKSKDANLRPNCSENRTLITPRCAHKWNDETEPRAHSSSTFTMMFSKYLKTLCAATLADNRSLRRTPTPHINVLHVYYIYIYIWSNAYQIQLGRGTQFAQPPINGAHSDSRRSMYVRALCTNTLRGNGVIAWNHWLDTWNVCGFFKRWTQHTTWWFWGFGGAKLASKREKQRTDRIEWTLATAFKFVYIRVYNIWSRASALLESAKREQCWLGAPRTTNGKLLIQSLSRFYVS